MSNSTSEIQITVKLSNNSYKIDILIFENDKLILKGELQIRSTPRYSWSEVQSRIKLGIKGQVWDVENICAPEFNKVR